MEKAGWGFLSCCEDVGAVRGRFVLEPGAYRRECSACRITAHVAQSVEHLHGKQKVSGSIPLVGSIVRIAKGRARVSRGILGLARRVRLTPVRPVSPCRED